MLHLVACCVVSVSVGTYEVRKSFCDTQLLSLTDGETTDSHHLYDVIELLVSPVQSVTRVRCESVRSYQWSSVFLTYLSTKVDSNTIPVQYNLKWH